MATLLRRYFIKPGHWDEFITMWHQVVKIRQRFGFTVEFACEDRDLNIFTWAISHPGDLEAVSARYYADPERIRYVAIKDHIASADIRPVKPVAWQLLDERSGYCLAKE